jgi:putative ABC transport system permease protein
MTGLLQDLRFALRQLKKSPGFAAVAIVTLGLGIGASTIIFSVVYNGVLYPFPYRSAEQLTAISVDDIQQQGKGSRGMYHLDEVAAFRSGNHTFEDILGYGLWYVTYTRRGGAEMLKGVGATPNAMEFWGVPPLLGRGLSEQDVQPGAPPVVLLNYRYWNREFLGDPGILGATMMLNGKARTIVGVMPLRFQAVGADLYMPVSWNRPEPVRGRFEWVDDDPLYFWATGILKRGVSLETAASDIDVIARELARIHSDEYPKNFRVSTKKLNDVVLADFKRTLLFLFAAVGLLLFISCSNVAGLLLAHASARAKEIALRAALGAGRIRILRQLLTESFLLAAVGAVVGCLLAQAGLKGVLALTQLANILPLEASISLNRPVLCFAVGISLLATLLCGLAPALHGVRADVQKGLASTGANVDPAFQHSRFRSGLVIGQVALSLLLLTCAGLLVRGFLALTRVDLGVQPEKIFTAEIHFPRGRYTTAEQKRVFFDRFLPQLNSVPGVASAAELIGLPLFFAPRGDVTIPGKPHREEWTTNVELCSEAYFQTLGRHLLRGRLLNADDILSARKVAVVSETLARKYFGGPDPIGRQIKFNVMDEIPETPHDAYFEIVGVVSDSRNYDFEGPGVMVLRRPEMTVPEGFLPYSVSGFGDRAIAMQTRVPPVSLVNHVRQILWTLDHDVVLVAPDVGGATGFSLDDLMQGLVYGKPKFSAFAFGACASLGFALAVVGLFSVMTYIVSLERHDIGVRMALGAPRAAILQLVLKRGLVLIVTGLALGLLASIGLTRFLSSQLRGISPTDPLTFVLVIPTVMLSGLSACFLPARHATRVDPMATLRNE